MVSPQISIIVPVYNTEIYLRRCIESLLSQVYTDFELLLVDDGSTDKSGIICDEYAAKDSRVHVYHKENGGVSSARNLGLDKARGEWVTYVDSDDYVDAAYCSELLKYSKDVDVVTCDMIIVDGDRETYLESYDWKDAGARSVGEYIVGSYTCVWGTLQRRSLYDEYKLRFPSGIKYCEDFHLMFKLYTYAKNVRRLDKGLYYYYQHPNSAVHNRNEETDRGERWVCTDLMEFADREGLIKESEQYLSWRLLYASVSMLRTPKRYREFSELYTRKRKYIFSCMFLSKRQKLIAWLVCYKMIFIAVGAYHTLKFMGKEI